MPTLMNNMLNCDTKMQCLAPQTEQAFHYKYLKEFRVDQCPLFLQHKCQQHRPFTCFNWHFQNQRRRRPIRKRDGTFNYSADVYCTKYDETTGICPDGDECPYLHRTAGDTERRYHLKYYKTGMCVHDTDNRGFCVKNGPHCAFAHGTNDLRPPVYDIRELQAIENGEANDLTGPNSLDKERCLLNDDPKWLDTTYVLANYKTEPCKKPPRLCRQGYACPQFHNNKDKRRSPKKYKYRSTPCPHVKSGDEWGDPTNCEAGDNCQYCHTRTEQQFHPEIYKSTKCNDMQNTSYCPRGAFCAFAHVEQETVSLESPPSHAEKNNLGEILSHVLPEEKTGHGSNEQMLQSDMNGIAFRTAPGAPMRNGSITPPFEENGINSPIEKHDNFTSIMNKAESLGTSIDSPLVSPITYQKNRFLSGDTNSDALIRRRLLSIENDPSLSPVEKAQRKASFFSEVNGVCVPTTSIPQTNFNGLGPSLFPTLGDSLEPLGSAFDDLALDPFNGNKSRKSSGVSDGLPNGFEMPGGDKSRNCSGSSLSAGITGILGSSGPNGTNTGNYSPPGGSPMIQSNGIMSQDNNNSLGLHNGIGLFDLRASSDKDAEIARLKEELSNTRSRLASWEEGIQQVRNACDAWKTQSTVATKKCELALKEKENAMAKVGQLQKELDHVSGGPYLHAVKRVSELKGLPLGVLKSLEWQLRKDLLEVEKVMRVQMESSQWMSNNRLFEFPPSGNDWSLGLIPTQHPLYGSLAQQ